MMKSEVTRRSRKLYELLPIGTLLGTPVYSVRIGRKWRALGSLEGNTVE
jgi:hypothetical protein